MRRFFVTINENDFEVEISGSPNIEGWIEVQVNGEPVRVRLPWSATSAHSAWAMVGNRPHEILIDHDLHWIQTTRGRHNVQIRDRDTPISRPRSGDGRVKAPIPGLIARILVEAGQYVEVGQPILVLEAMKMQNEITAPRSGTISMLNIQPGQSVKLHELLIEIS
ncbi:acetyl-CoA carboxylase biotin carboxyl carrier protein subunit [Candidatus Chloroploca sp. Khr17]|uniref:acetyl-CoA carboxylase biotin carboxyl carrier protein subunit n=1 Tax=Candidatus Chloroploca sp. Khr17 TaxID=2496869 RepID=UPI00101CA10E|nr:acetyl-CoA carboxylase biotin carboxyl carrier protein subunit [Candidatus Chloroploca sp. Khr17]